MLLLKPFMDLLQGGGIVAYANLTLLSTTNPSYVELVEHYSENMFPD